MMKSKEDFYIGVYVLHSVYGFGQVIANDGIKVTLLFVDGFQDRFTLDYLIKGTGVDIIHYRRERISDLQD